MGKEMKYNVGDRVLIKSLDWYNENKDENGSIDLNYDFTFYASRSKYCGKVFTIAEVFSDCYGVKDDNNKYNEYYWIDEMIECKVEEEIKPKFKVGDILFYRGETSGYLKVEEIRVENGDIRYYETSRNVYLLENDPDVFADKVCSVETEETGSENKLLDDYEELTDRAFKGGYEKCKSDIELNGFKLPEGYQFVDENGNAINATKITLRKKKEVIPNLQLDSIRTVREYDTAHSRIWLEIYEDNPNLCIFTHLLVDEDHRRKGYGTKALEQAEIIAKDLGCDTINLKVETYSWMYNWYLRSGYKFLTNAEDNYTWLTKSI